VSRLEYRFLLAAAAAALLPLMLVWAAGWQLARGAYLEAARARLAGTALALAAQLERRIAAEDAVLKSVCRLAGDDPAWAAEVALAALDELDEIEVNGRLASRFRVVGPGDALPPAPDGSVRDDAWGEPLLRRATGCAGGRVRADLRLRPLLAPVGRVGGGLRARLFGPGGRLLARSGPGGPPGRWLSTRKRLANGWQVEVALPERALLGPLYRANAAMLALLALALFASALPGVRLGRSLARPLGLLARAAGDLEAGRRPPPIPETGPEEARRAIRAFNRMAEAQAARTEALEQAVKARTHELALALAKARAANRAKTRFLAAVSHELRTPLTSIKGYASSLRSPDVDWSEEERREFLAVIEEEADRLARRVDDLLDFARAERGELALVPVPLDAAAWLRAQLPRLRALAAGHPLTLDLDPRLPVLAADPDRLWSLLANLVENAARHTPPGTPIKVWARPAPGGLELGVEDRGPGIPDAEKERVFEPFHRLDDRPGGSGIGLAVARMVVEAHGGRVAIEDAPEGGTRVRVWLPAEGNDADTGGG